jgi:diaminopimelate epimerase
VSQGNPHTVILVKDFDFDWRSIGADIETARFPERHQRGIRTSTVAQPTAGGRVGARRRRNRFLSTGAAAAVAAMVMLGLADRCCEVQFELGALSVNWRESDDVIELTGPAQLVMEGVYEFR